jgi:hypothetical protein
VTQEKSWQRVKDERLEREYVKLEKLIDLFLARGDVKIVQAIEKERLTAEGDLTAMQALNDGYYAEYQQLVTREQT